MLKTTKSESGRIVAAFGIVICCWMLIVAVPRFIASLYALYPEAVLKQMQENLPVPVYEKSIADYNHALTWYENPEYYQAQALIYLTLYNATPSQLLKNRQELLKKAQTSIIHGLTLSPLDPFVWFRLAVVNKMLKLPSENIINALRLSFYAGRVEPDLLMPRLALSYDYYNELNDETQRLWQKQIPVIWVFHAEQLVKFIALHPKAEPLVKEAFANSPDDLKKFSHALEIVLQKNP